MCSELCCILHILNHTGSLLTVISSTLRNHQCSSLGMSQKMAHITALIGIFVISTCLTLQGECISFDLISLIPCTIVIRCFTFYVEVCYYKYDTVKMSFTTGIGVGEVGIFIINDK